jgi:hypothetical protein
MRRTRTVGLLLGLAVLMLMSGFGTGRLSEARADAAPVAQTPLAFGSGFRFDDQAPFAHPWAIDSLSCPTSTMCAAVDEHGDILTTSDPTAPASGWQRVAARIDRDDGLSCPTAALCVAVGQVGGAETVLASSNPTGGPGAWQSYQLPAGWEASDLTCPTASFCAALGLNGTILTTNDPLGGSFTWQSAAYSTTDGGDALACASATLCVIGTWDGTVFSSKNPTGGPGDWTAATVMPIGRLSCPTANLCAGVGIYGLNVAVTTDPTGGSSAWSETTLDSNEYSNGSAQITCRSDGFCVALDADGSVATTHDAQSGAATWSRVQQTSPPSGDGSTWGAATCPADNFCAAPAPAGSIDISTDPAGPTGSWTGTQIDGYNLPTGVSCTSDAFCAAVDDAGNVLTTTQPQTPGYWNATAIAGHPLTAISCMAGPTCIAVDTGGDVLTSTDPAGGPDQWTTVPVDPGNQLIAVSCASGPVCMAVDDAGNAIVSTDPAGGQSAWHLSSILDITTNTTFTGVSCADATLCVASTTDGLQIATSPGQPGGGWKNVRPSAPGLNGSYGPGFSSISCPSASFCMASNSYDGVSTTDPTGDAPSWQASLIAYDNPDRAVRCESSALCLGINDADTTYETSQPTADYTHWGTATPDDNRTSLNQTDAACPTADFCIIVGDAGEAWVGEAGTGTPPSAPTPAPPKPVQTQPPYGGPHGSSTTTTTASPPAVTSASPGNSATNSSPNTSTTASASAAPSSSELGVGSPGSTDSPLAAGAALARTSTVTLAATTATAAIVVGCPAKSAGCAGTASLTLAPAASISRVARTRRETGVTVIGRSGYELRAGRVVTVIVRLNRTARELLRRSRGHRLVARLTLTPHHGASRTFRITLTLKKTT